MSAPATGAQLGARAGFVALLANPLVTAARHPQQYAQILRQRQGVTELARRFGYRVRVVGQAIRLERVPLAGTVTHPPMPVDAPTRRVLALTCLVAAACEDTDGATTLAELSAGVAALTSTPGTPVAAYDPDNQAHRRQLVRAVSVLSGHGVLTVRTGSEQVEAWAESRTGAGAGYQVERDALLLLTSPDILALAASVPEPTSRRDSRRVRLLRQLLETPALLYADLHAIDPDDADLARTTRGLLKGPVTSATGGHIEDRAEGLVLVVDDGTGTSPIGTAFPTAKTESWAALLAADAAGQAGRRDADGRVHLDDDQVGTVLAELLEDRGKYLRADLRDNPVALRAAVERQLAALALLTLTDDDGWVLSAAAGRYRAPEVMVAEPATAGQPGPGTLPDVPPFLEEPV